MTAVDYLPEDHGLARCSMGQVSWSLNSDSDDEMNDWLNLLNEVPSTPRPPHHFPKCPILLHCYYQKKPPPFLSTLIHDFFSLVVLRSR